MLTDKSFTNPYARLPETDKIVTSINIANADRAFLFSLFPNQSVVQTTINILLARCVEELKANGFKHYDPERFQLAIANCRVVINGGASGAPSNEADKGHDGRGIGNVRPEDAGLSDELPNAPGRSTRKPGGKGKEKGPGR